MAGVGIRRQLTPEEQEQRAIQQEQRAALHSMNQLQRVGEQGLVKIIGKGAYGRIKQIQLQLQGPRALLQEEMIEKLNLADETSRRPPGIDEWAQPQLRRDEMRTRMQFMQSALPAPADGRECWE